jgi:hypothetical protein
MSTILYTSLSEIRSFNPCPEGWRDILSAHPHSTQEEMNALFPLIDCLKSNSISDVCWLLEQRKTEIQICVRFARKCADSVAHLKNIDATYANAYAAAATYATNAAQAATYATNARAIQLKKNKQFLRETILQYEQEH